MLVCQVYKNSGAQVHLCYNSNSMKALITGISGFVGTHLSHLLLEKGFEVFGIERSKAKTDPSEARIFEGDLLDESFVKKIISEVNPRYIFHLAAFTSPADSFLNPRETLLNNIGITVNLLEAARGYKAKILVVSSAHIYGLVKENENPVSEKTPLRPESPYAVSKLAQDFLALAYHNAYKMRIVRVRPANQIGPGQRPGMVVPSFAMQIAEAEAGKREPILKVGNLEAIRDFTDVRDMVKAYYLAIMKGKSGEVYNLGSGKGLRIREILDKLISFSNIKLKVEQDATKKRPVDIPKLIIDATKFKNLTGWHSETQIDKSLEDTLNWCKEKVNNE